MTVNQQASVPGSTPTSGDPHAAVVTILIPHVQTEAQRRALITSAFHSTSEILGRMNYSGTAPQFTRRLVALLREHGEVSPGTQALWHLLETLKGTVGDDIRAQIDQLKAYANMPPMRLSESAPSKAHVLALAILALIASLLIIDMVQGLMRAGESALGAAASVFTIVPICASLILYAWQQTSVSTFESRKAWHPFLILGVIILVVLIGKPQLYKTLAQQQITRALNTSDLTEAQTALNAAQTLGEDVRPLLHDTLIRLLNTPNVDETMLLNQARLIRQYGPVDPALIEHVKGDLEASFAAGNQGQLQRSAQVLALLDADAAGALANDWHDAGVEALSKKEVNPACLYLDTVRVIDLYETGRTADAKEKITFNLGLLRDRTSKITAVLDTYASSAGDNADLTTGACRPLSSADYLAVYHYASQILTEQEAAPTPDQAALATAAEAVRQAVDRLECETRVVSPVLAQTETNEHCFFLLTTLAGLLLQRDPHANVAALVGRAIWIANKTEQFSQSTGRVYTGEAYHYAALIDESPSLETLCAVERYSNSTLERHRDWIASAEAQRAELYPDATCPQETS